MATETRSSSTSTTKTNHQQHHHHREPQPEKRHRSIFEVPSDFFDSCRLLPSPSFPISEPSDISANPTAETVDDGGDDVVEDNGDDQKADQSGAKNAVVPRLSCNTCKAEFESLTDQRSHFKSDYHRFNVKLSIAGKGVVKEEDFDELTSDSLAKDFDVSSISGSDDEGEKDVFSRKDANMGLSESVKQKLFIHLRTGERVSLWKCLLLSESENISFENDRSVMVDTCLRESEVVEKLKYLIHEPRNNTHLRVVLLASGGHFAGCVFDGNSVVAHKTFHRYVIRGKGKKQSSKDASGKTAHSAGASLRRYNELALKKEIQELLAAWKPYFDASSCTFVSAPSNNRQLLYDGDKPYFSYQHCVVQNVPLTVKRPTLKEARRIYNQLTQVFYELDDRECLSGIIDSTTSTSAVIDSHTTSIEDSGENLDHNKAAETCSSCKKSEPAISSDSDSEVIGITTPLHEAVKCGNAQKVLELLEQGLDPCIKDERGRTPYMLATEKEVRNSFRRFMASNLDMWDWITAKVPSALTKEMEDSQAAKQAEKDAKKKARAKELKKLRKAREKNAQVAQAALSQTASTALGATSLSALKGQSQSRGGLQISKEEEQKRAQAAEREKRAAAAERRLAAGAALDAQGTSTTIAPGTSHLKSGVVADIQCSCCKASLSGIVPFHRYNYKYCSTSCMHVHKQILEDG